MPDLETPYMPSHLGEYAVYHDNTQLLDLIERATARNVSGNFECRRCDRVFGSRSAREQHWEASGQHFICLALDNNGNRCNFDGITLEGLLQHYLIVHNLQSCRGCVQVFVDFNVYMDHLDREFACPECQKHHDTENSVEQHMITHRKPNVDCWGCDRAFTSRSAMLLHLEAGCPSGINRHTLNQHAASFILSWKFVDPAHRHELMHPAEFTQEYPAGNLAPFMCPDVSCHGVFITLSGLFQHAEFGKCPASLNEGVLSSLMAWLAHKTTQTLANQPLSRTRL